MKRKLNEENIPTPVEENSSYPASDAPTTFEALGLEPRLLQAISKQSFGKPTSVQARAIPLILEGKDVIARAKTGSGKTAAYVLPVLQSILQRKIEKPKEKVVRGLILVTSKELAQQVSKAVSDFCAFCAKDIQVLNLNRSVSNAVQRSLLAQYPDIVVSTPAQAWINITSSALSLDNLSHLVIDEADLVLSYGHQDDLGNIAKSLPDGLQTTLTSATISDEADDVTKQFCKDPVVLALDGPDDTITQYITKCAEDEKFLFLYIIMKLKLIKGKTIIFVDDIDRCYRVKLYLEQFGIRSCVLNSELPVNSRLHVVEQFNKGVYDIMIASDEYEVTGSGRSMVAKSQEDGIENVQGEEAAEDDDDQPKKKKRKASKRDKEYGISRGIDFKNVACVLNFDLPRSSKSYTHRIGRTGRAGKAGMALSFVIPRALHRKHKPTSIASTQHDEDVLANIVKHQAKKGAQVEDYPFDPSKVEGFKYRTSDALRAVTSIAIRQARTSELRNELIKSDKLKRHFEENPEELYHLRHDGELHAVRVQPHLKHVPDYLMPDGGAKAVGGEIGFVGLGKTSQNRIRRSRQFNKARGKGRLAKTKRSDPLKTFNARGRGKK